MSDNKEKVYRFEIYATRCKRCGGILTSTYGLQNGYGYCCHKKDKEEKQQFRNQLTIEGFIKNEEV